MEGKTREAISDPARSPRGGPQRRDHPRRRLQLARRRGKPHRACRCRARAVGHAHRPGPTLAAARRPPARQPGPDRLWQRHPPQQRAQSPRQPPLRHPERHIPLPEPSRRAGTARPLLLLPGSRPPEFRVPHHIPPRHHRPRHVHLHPRAIRRPACRPPRDAVTHSEQLAHLPGFAVATGPALLE